MSQEEALDLVAQSQRARAAALEERVRRFVRPQGDERALDVGSGLGALALALAPSVREVVGVELQEERVERARELAAGVDNVEFVVADAHHLPFERASFDLSGTLRTLHHVPRPELVVAELARVTRPGGHVLVVDQLAPIDPLEAVEVDRFERARDPSHTRLLPDTDLRGFFDANRLVLLQTAAHDEERELERYLDLAGCHGEARERAAALAPGTRLAVRVGWYLLRRA
jgi:ubiquinone/menaquinone biosynthesis C-methylase UbiE